MGDIPTITIGESPSKFRRTMDDNVIKSDSDGGYEFRRRRFTRKPSYIFQTGFIGISQAEKDTLEAFWEDKLTDTAFTYDDYINGSSYNVTFDKPMDFKYTGVGPTRIWEVTIYMRQV